MKKSTILILLLASILLVSGCNLGKDSITKDARTLEQVAQGLSVLWTQKDYASAYDLFTQDLKSLRSKEDFVEFIKAKGSEAEFSLIYEKVVQQNDKLAYAYYIASVGIAERKIPPLTLELTNEGWRINGFAGYFEDSCAEECFNLRCSQNKCDSSTKFECKYENIEPCNCDGDYLNFNAKNSCPSSEKPVCKNNICVEGCNGNYNDYDAKSRCQTFDKPLCENNVCVRAECILISDCGGVPFKDRCEKLGEDYEFRNMWCENYKCVVSCINLKTKNIARG